MRATCFLPPLLYKKQDFIPDLAPVWPNRSLPMSGSFGTYNLVNSSSQRCHFGLMALANPFVHSSIHLLVDSGFLKAIYHLKINENRPIFVISEIQKLAHVLVPQGNMEGPQGHAQCHVLLFLFILKPGTVWSTQQVSKCMLNPRSADFSTSLTFSAGFSLLKFKVHTPGFRPLTWNPANCVSVHLCSSAGNFSANPFIECLSNSATHLTM